MSAVFRLTPRIEDVVAGTEKEFTLRYIPTDQVSQSSIPVVIQNAVVSKRNACPLYAANAE